MNDPNRIQHLKLILTTVVLVIGGIALITAGELLNPDSLIERLVPWTELGGILIGAGLLGIWLDHHFKREQRDASDARLREILQDHAPALRDAMLDAFAANHQDLARVATPTTLDQITTTSLGLRLHDREFAEEIFGGLSRAVINAPERWTDALLEVSLTPTNPEGSSDAYFVVTARWEYTTVPRHTQRRFVCLSDRSEFRQVARDDGTSAWFFKPDPHFDASDRTAFELVQFAVDGDERRVRRSSRSHYQAYTADVGADVVEAGKPVTISYTYRTITSLDAHLLFFDLEQPTRDLHLSFDYTDTDITAVSAIDMFALANTSRIEHSPDTVPTRTVRVDVEGWAIPASGVAIVWSTTDRTAKKATGRTKQRSRA